VALGRALVAAVVGLAGVCGPPATGVAHAASGPVTATVALTQSNWYWREQSGNPCQATSATSVPDPLPAGDLAVGGPEGPKCSDGSTQADKETYLAFDMSHVPMGSTIVSFKLSLPIDPSGPTFVAGGVPAPAIACAVDNSWSGGPGAQSFGGKPHDTCAKNAPRLASAGGGQSYQVDIAPIAQGWVTAGVNNGVAITDDPANSSVAYQLVFGPPAALAKVVGQVSYQPPGSSSSPSTGAGSVSAPPSAPSDTGSAVPTEPAPALPPSATSGPLPAEPAPVAPTPPAAATPPSPTVSPGTSASAGRTGAPASSSSIPPAGFWAAGIVFLLLLLYSSLFVSDEASRRTRRGPTSRALDHLRYLRTNPSSEAT